MLTVNAKRENHRITQKMQQNLSFQGNRVLHTAKQQVQVVHDKLSVPDDLGESRTDALEHEGLQNFLLTFSD